MAGNNRGFLGNLGGRAVDKIAWGNNRDPRTGRVYVTPGQLAGGAASRVLNMFVPGAGTFMNFIGNRIVKSRTPSFVEPESVGMPQPMSVQTIGSSKPDTRSGTVGQPALNLGLGTGVNPYQGWTNYMADPGSRDNFGNNYLGGGYTGAGFNPSSQWGRNLLNSPNTNPGSIQNFGNNLDALRGGRERLEGGGIRRTDPNRDLSNRTPRYGDPRQLLTSRNPYQST